MKSKTSCFNVTIFKKNVAHYWPIWGAYLCYLLFMLPFMLYLGMTDERSYYGEISEVQRMYQILRDCLDNTLEVIPVFLFAMAMAMAVFAYLYTARNANMMHALPVNRLELFVTNYLSGLAFLLVPEMITFFVSILVCTATGVTCMQYLLIWLIYIAGISFFAYSLAVFVAMFTGQLFALPAYYVIVNFLYVGCLYMIETLIGALNYGVLFSWNPGKTCMLSPMYYLTSQLYTRLVYEDGAKEASGIEMYGGSLVGIYAAAAVVIVVAAYQIYKRRQIETAGDLVSIRQLRPIFRWGASLCGSLLLALLFSDIFVSYNVMEMFPSILVCLVVSGGICFFGAEMLLEKKFRVFQKKRLLEWAGFTVAAVLFVTLFEMDAFGVERYIPKEDEIEAAFVDMDYPMMLEGEQIPEILSIHQQLVADKAFCEKNAKGERGYYYTTIRYYLKDGSRVDRRYPMPFGEELLADSSSPAAKIVAWETDSEQMKTLILGMGYQENRYYSGQIDLYSEEGKSKTVIIEEDKINQLIKAVELDIEEGNFDRYYLGSLSGDNTTTYWSGISLNYYNTGRRFYDEWDYYENYRNYQEGQQSKVERATSDHITLGPDCVHTVEKLAELGITDETWKLMTRDEWETWQEKTM